MNATSVVRWSDLCREPFRVFFPLAVIFGGIGTGHWLRYAVGYSTSASVLFHASVQVNLYMGGFIVGFLMTALPRFTSAPPATSVELGVMLALFALQAACLSIGWWVAAESAFVTVLAQVAWFALRRVAQPRRRATPQRFTSQSEAWGVGPLGGAVLEGRAGCRPQTSRSDVGDTIPEMLRISRDPTSWGVERCHRQARGAPRASGISLPAAPGAAQAGPPPEFVWIGVSLGMGLAGAALMMIAQLTGWRNWWLAMGAPMAQQGLLFSIVLGVGGFLAPRLLGRGFLPANPDGMESAHVAHARRQRVQWHAAAAIGLMASFILEGWGYLQPAYLLRAAIVTAELAWTTQLHRPPRTPGWFARLLWISLWMLPLGLWTAGLWPRYRVAMLHISFLGGLSLMTFVIGTMVTFSHSGASERLQRPMGMLGVVGVALAVAVASRVAAACVPAVFFPAIAVAAIAWWIAAAVWLAGCARLLMRPQSPEDVEQTHEAAKRRVLAHAEPGLSVEK